eukprot:scaffold7019_cov22-Tisochrysis_lutea.AAC.2
MGMGREDNGVCGVRHNQAPCEPSGPTGGGNGPAGGSNGPAGGSNGLAGGSNAGRPGGNGWAPEETVRSVAQADKVRMMRPYQSRVQRNRVNVTIHGQVSSGSLSQGAVDGLLEELNKHRVSERAGTNQRDWYFENRQHEQVMEVVEQALEEGFLKRWVITEPLSSLVVASGQGYRNHSSRARGVQPAGY